MPSKQKQKYHLSLCGEYLVAGELQRRGINASVTYGNAKSADVVAFSESRNRVITVEVKTTGQPKWVIGNHVPESSQQPWVFVFAPPDHSQSPEYYVVSQQELHEIFKNNDDGYNEKYRDKHGKEFSGKGVISVKKPLLLVHKGQWEKIIRAVNELEA